MTNSQTAKKKPARPAKDKIENFPPHAQFEWKGGRWYVYFPYTYMGHVNGVRKQVQDRDYIGFISTDEKCFEPNETYVLLGSYKWEERPSKYWKDPKKRKKAEEREQERERIKKALSEGSTDDTCSNEPKVEESSGATKELPIDNTFEESNAQLSVGATAVAAAVLEKNGMIDDLISVLHNPKDAIHVCNLAIHAAITAKATYQASIESMHQKFIGDGGCLCSSGASNLFKMLGSNSTLPVELGKARLQRVAVGSVLALDGTEIPSSSKNIEYVKLGKKKTEGYGDQVNLSLLVDAATGAAITYRPYGGNVIDMSTIPDLSAMWRDIGLLDKAATIVADRGYFAQKQAFELNDAGFKFIFGTKSSFDFNKSTIEKRSNDLYMPRNYISQYKCYGVKDEVILERNDGDPLNLSVYVFRNTQKQEEAISELTKNLKNFELSWVRSNSIEKDKLRSDPLYRYYYRNHDNRPLVLNQDEFETDCYDFGIFSMAGNIDKPIIDVLDIYKKRNTIEVDFKLLFNHLMGTTRSHYTYNFDGLLFVTFVGLNILTYINKMMTNSFKNEFSRDGESILKKIYTISELFNELRSVRMTYSYDGSPRLLNVTRREKEIVKALGLEGLFDNPENVERLLSGSLFLKMK